MDATLLDTYDRAAGILRKAYAGLNDAQLDAVPIVGTWSLRQILYHLAYSDAVGVDRMLRIAAEEKPPLLIGYDETAGTVPLIAAGHPADELLMLFDLNRKAFSRIARRLPAQAFEKFGIHNEVGKVTLGEQIKKYQWHFEHHLKFVEKKREMVM